MRMRVSGGCSGLRSIRDRCEFWSRKRCYFSRGRDFYEFGVTVPFSAPSIAAPAVYASSTVPPLRTS
jgi:hypothetical protein